MYQRKYEKYKNKYEKIIEQLGGEIVLNVQPFHPVDEIHFWSKQMMEHSLFMHLGLENHELKTLADSLCSKWKKFLHKTFYSKKIVVDDKTVFLSDDDIKKIGNVDKHKVDKLINQTLSFNKNIIETLQSGKWLGWIYISLAEHMQEETEYFKNKIDGKYFSIDDEIKFANHHHSGEMGVTAQLIDPCEEQQIIIDVVRSYALKNMSKFNKHIHLANTTDAKKMLFPKNWSEKEESILKGAVPTDSTNMLMLAIKFGDEIIEIAEDTGNKIDSHQLKSNISTILAKHAYREFVRLNETLRRLRKTD